MTNVIYTPNLPYSVEISSLVLSEEEGTATGERQWEFQRGFSSLEEAISYADELAQNHQHVRVIEAI